MNQRNSRIILNTIKDYQEDEYDVVIERYKTLEITMALAKTRSNCIEWIKLLPDEKVLEWGADYGAITGTLCKKSSHVVCFEHDPAKSKIIKERTKGYVNPPTIYSDIHQFNEDFNDCHFSTIFLIGSLEKATQYFKSNRPEEALLAYLSNFLAQDGQIIIVCANKFGLKYWSGCFEENSRRLFEGLEGYPNRPEFNSFTIHGMERIAKNSKLFIDDVKFLYPDHKITFAIFSHEYQPYISSLYLNNFPWEEKRAKLFSETKVFDNILREDLFFVFSNAFLFVLKKRNAGKNTEPVCNKQIFIKYSNVRSQKFQIRTDIIQDKYGNRVVEKRGLHDATYTFLNNMLDTYRNNYQTLAEHNIDLIPCQAKDDYIVFEYMSGPTFSEHLCELLNKRKTSQFKKEILLFFNRLKHASPGNFHITEEFVQVFGDVNFDTLQISAPISNIDLNFDNIFVHKKRYTIIDYEWTFNFPIPMGFIINGSLSIFFNHFETDHNEWKILKKELLGLLNISDQDVIQFNHMWYTFKDYMMGENQSTVREYNHSKSVKILS